MALLLALCGSAIQAQEKHIPDVIYGKKIGVALTLDVFKPANPNGIGVLWMVSGGWVSNHNNIDPRIAKIYNAKGITVFAVVHGSQPKFTLKEIVKDIHRAVRFVRTHAKEYGVDPNRLGISGGSAGGHLSLTMGAYGDDGDPNSKDEVERASSKVQAVACFFPPTDFLNYAKEGQSAMQISTLKGYWHVFEVTEKTPDEERVRIAKALSPIYGLNEKSPPTMLIHGDMDTLVPLQQSELVIDKLKKLNVPCELIVAKGKGHGWLGIEKDADTLADWFLKYLGTK
jgi:acetyl esterase/lipase